MRFIYGAMAIAFWLLVVVQMFPSITEEELAITCAIVAAGAMAGGA